MLKLFHNLNFIDILSYKQQRKSFKKIDLIFSPNAWGVWDLVSVIQKRRCVCSVGLTNHLQSYWNWYYIKNIMNVLGVTFNSRLHWLVLVTKTILKAYKAHYAIKLIKHLFTFSELLTYFNLKIQFSPLLQFRNMAYAIP